MGATGRTRLRAHVAGGSRMSEDGCHVAGGSGMIGGPTGGTRLLSHMR